MQQVIINNDLIGEEELCYFQDNGGWYYCKYFVFREEYCFIEDDNISIKEEFACIKEIGYLPYEYQCACSISFKTIKGEKFAILEYSNVKYKIPYIFYKNVIEALYCDVYVYNDSKSNNNDNRLIFFDNNEFIGWLEPGAFEVYNVDVYIEEDAKPVPKEIEENFIFDFVYYFGKDGYAGVRKDNWCAKLGINGNLYNRFTCSNLFSTDNYNYITIADKEGVVDENGKFIIPPKYDSICQFDKNLWRVSLNEKYGLIDNDCNIIWDLKYDSINFLYNNEGYLVSLNGIYGIIDINEKEIMPLKYDNLIKSYINQNCFYATLNGKKGIINLKNEIIIPFEYEDIFYLEGNNLAAKMGSNRFMIINEQNQQICETVFEDMDIDSSFSENPALYSTKLNNKWGFIDKDGNVIIDFNYTDTCPVFGDDEKYVGISIDDKTHEDKSTFWIIDKNENQILPFECEPYGFIVCIDDNRFIIQKDGKYGIVDKNNNIIADFIFDDITTGCEFDTIKYYSARINDKHGFIDRDGKPLKIDKESLKIPETKLDMSQIPAVEQMSHLFS